MKLTYTLARWKVWQALRLSGLTPTGHAQTDFITDAIGHVMGRLGQEEFVTDEPFSEREQRQLAVVFDTLSSLLADEKPGKKANVEVGAAAARCLNLLSAIKDPLLLRELDCIMST